MDELKTKMSKLTRLCEQENEIRQQKTVLMESITQRGLSIF